MIIIILFLSYPAIKLVLFRLRFTISWFFDLASNLMFASEEIGIWVSQTRLQVVDLFLIKESNLPGDGADHYDGHRDHRRNGSRQSITVAGHLLAANPIN